MTGQQTPSAPVGVAGWVAELDGSARPAPFRGPVPAVPAALAALLAAPDLTGALCRGRDPWWDDNVAGEGLAARSRRLLAAVAACRGCPVLAKCAQLLPELPRSTSGVWAGQVLSARRSS